MGQLDIHIRHGHGGAELGEAAAGVALVAAAAVLASALAQAVVWLLAIAGLALVLGLAALVLYLRRPRRPPPVLWRPAAPRATLPAGAGRQSSGHNQGRPAPRQLQAPAGHVLAGWALDGEPIWRRAR